MAKGDFQGNSPFVENRILLLFVLIIEENDAIARPIRRKGIPYF
ncbi:hypothetical protein HMPREF1985_00170 [Mitsuokella sp. oral taxon 131 str. W9106]|nr:hypothetical protein HMPREF1985_00170 [Mitsuokella sp. oral taxon 131 str. W9106]